MAPAGVGSVGAVTSPFRAIHIVIDAHDVDELMGFWAAATGYEPFGQSGQYRSAVPPAGAEGPKLVFQQVDDVRSGAKNRLHLDIVAGDEMASEAERLVGLGARRLSETIAEAGTEWIVMADPEGNEFCLVRE